MYKTIYAVSITWTTYVLLTTKQVLEFNFHIQIGVLWMGLRTTEVLPTHCFCTRTKYKAVTHACAKYGKAGETEPCVGVAAREYCRT